MLLPTEHLVTEGNSARPATRVRSIRGGPARSFEFPRYFEFNGFGGRLISPTDSGRERQSLCKLDFTELSLS